MIALDLGLLRQVVTLTVPVGAPVPDGDGGFTQLYAPLDPPVWRCRIEPRTPRPSEITPTGTVLSHATHVFTGRFHPGITTQARLAWTDRAGAEHVAEVLDADDTDGAGVESVVLATELAR